MAEAMLKKMLKDKGIGEDKFIVKSAGVSALSGARPTKETIEVMWNLGIDVSEHRSARLSDDAISEADIILVMEQEHKDEIIRRAQGARDKVFLLKEYNNNKPGNADKDAGISDPIGRTVNFYEDTLIDIQNALKGVVEFIANKREGAI